MTDFTEIRFEVLIGTTWVNLTPDVKVSPPPQGNRGIMGNDPQAQLGDTGRLTFSLDNSHGNSAGLIGYYSPGHANCLSGWTTGLPVRLSFSYAGLTRYKWYGRIEPDGIKVIPGSKGPRRVDVTCFDFMGQAAYHRLNQVQPQTNVDIDDALDLILANMPTQPLAKEFDKTLPSSLPYLFDNLSPTTTALSEMYKLTQNHAFSYIYVKGDGIGGETMVLAGSGPFAGLIPNVTTTNELLLETGDHLLLEDGSFLLLDESESLAFTDADILPGTEFSYGKNVFNYITLVDYPRRIDAAATTVLYSLESAQQLAHNTSITFWGTYKDPTGVSPRTNGTNMVTPVSGTDFAAFANSDGTGTNYTANMTVTAEFFASDVKFTVTNNHATDSFYFGGPSIVFQCRGKGIYLDDPARVVVSDATSITQFGVRALNFDWKYAYTGIDIASHANSALTFYKDPVTELDSLKLSANKNAKNLLAFMFWEPHQAATVTETVTGFNRQVVMQGYNFEIRDGKNVFWDVVTT